MFLLFIGQYGTGKTAIATEVVRIKKADFEKDDVKVEVNVLMFNKHCKKLLENLRDKWCRDYKDQVKFASFTEFINELNIKKYYSNGRRRKEKEMKDLLQEIGKVKNGKH